MNLYKIKDSANASSHPRTLYSVGLLFMLITFASWVLLSYPISTAVRNYFYGVNGIGDMNSQASWQITTPREVNSTEKSNVDLQQLKDKDGVDVNREDKNKEISEEKPSEIRNNEKITPGINWQNTTPSEVNSSENATIEITENPTPSEVNSSENATIEITENPTPSEVNNSENATIGITENPNVQQSKDRNGVDVNREDEKKDLVQQLKNKDGVDVNQDDEKKDSADKKSNEIKHDEKITPGISWQNMTPSEANSSENATAGITESLDVQHSKDKEGLGAKDEDNKKVNGEPSEVSNNENTTQGVKISQDLLQTKDGAVDTNQENKDKQMVDDGKSDQVISEDTLKNDTTYNNPSPPIKGECDLFHGEWFYDEAGPLYTNNSCPVITQMQNCQGNGRPDKRYENWRWRPSHCELPRFDANKFLELMSGKTLAFVGDSVARNQMESLLCILWQVEVPKNRGNRHMQRWYFRSKSVMIVRIWSSWLVRQSGAPFKDVPEGVSKVFLDVPDDTFMQYVAGFDVVVLSSGHWFAKQSAYIKNNEIVGTQLWSPPNPQQSQVNNVEAFGISSETAMAALATNPNFTGIAILRSFSPDHYEGGAWNTGGSCTGKVEPARPGQLVENGFTNAMYEKQVNGFNLGVKKQTNGAKLRLMDITEVFSYRHDGHPGPFRSTDPNKVTKRGPDGRPPPQDCLHWCMPGPVDTWNELVLEIIRREYEK